MAEGPPAADRPAADRPAAEVSAGESRVLPQEIIRRKRDGAVLSTGEIEAFVSGLTRGSIGGEQIAAFAMAVYFKGMNRAETVALVESMTRSGSTLEWRGSALPGPMVDKHSTGGIGDNVSLILAPALAACGAFVPMLSGRGLGHTGGTLDKLEAIPGYRTRVAQAEFQRVVRDTGCAIVGATADLAPADARLYAIRDVTATVESIPLITASILSKKRAAGVEALVMDVKTGSGAFMASMGEARTLAESLVDVATGAGLPTIALVTDMDQPLADAAGNAVEVRHALAVLCGARFDPRVQAVVAELGGEALRLGGLVTDAKEGMRRIEAAIRSGHAAERFAAMVRALGGPADLLERPDSHLPEAPVRREVFAERSGFVGRIDARRIGLAVVGLGGGRMRPEDVIDAAVGFADLAALGTPVGRDGPRALGTVLGRSEDAVLAAAALLRRAYTIADAPPEPRPPVLGRIAAEGIP